MEVEISNRLATLGHPQRLSIFRLLMRRYPDRVPAGDIADALGIKGSTLSSYLSALMRDGLITQERKGTSLLYSPALETIQATFDFLLNDCGRGRADLLPRSVARDARGGRAMTDHRPYRVLFICTGNSARSIFAETLLRDLGGVQFEAYSAGTRPRSELNPFAVKVLQDKGHDISHLRSKNVGEFQGSDTPAFDFVFTVCDRAANEECPAWAGQPVSAHWGMPDPVKAEGTDAQKALAFQQAYGALRNRIIAFTNLPLDTLGRISLQGAVDRIGRMGDEASA